MSSLNFLCCVGIAGDQRLLFIRHAVAAEAGHGTIHQSAVWGIHGKNVECVLTHTMKPCISTTFLFSDLVMAYHLPFGASASAARNPNIWVPGRFLRE
jgi:hypothetical protein